LKQKLTNRSGVLEAHVDAAGPQIVHLVADLIPPDPDLEAVIIPVETDPAPQWRPEAVQAAQLTVVVEQVVSKTEQRLERRCCQISKNNHNKTDESTSATYPTMLSGIILKIL
jgi:hypothetical protein